MESSNSPNKTLIAIIVVVLLVAATTAVVVLTNNKSSTDSSSVASDLPTNAPSGSSDEEAISSNTTFKNGTYDATGSYQTPGGQESIGVQVTLTDGVISDASVTQQGKTGEAQEYQEAFASGFKSQVVGKKVSEVTLSRVAGSSLTPNGFNDALNGIAKQAQS